MRKLSFEENLRHRLHERGKAVRKAAERAHLPGTKSASATQAILCVTAGAVAGIAIGMALAQRFGGFGAISARLYDSLHGDHLEGYDAHDYDDEPLDDEDFDDDEELDEDDEDDVTDHYDEDDDFDNVEALDEDEEFNEDFDFDTGQHETVTLTDAEILEERVLEAYRNDPILSERAVDIGALDAETIELTGWVESAEEVEHAGTIARGTPGVVTVINQLKVGPPSAGNGEIG